MISYQSLLLSTTVLNDIYVESIFGPPYSNKFYSALKLLIADYCMIPYLIVYRANLQLNSKLSYNRYLSLSTVVLNSRDR